MCSMINKYRVILSVFSVTFAFSAAVHAADVVSLKKVQKEFVGKLQLNPAALQSHQSKMSKLLNPSILSTFKTSTRSLRRSGKTHQKLQQYFKGVPVQGYEAIVTKNSQGLIDRLHGYVAQNIEDDISSVMPTISKSTALETAKELHKKFQIVKDGFIYENISKDLVIHIDRKNVAKLAYRVSFLADQKEGGLPSRPVVYIDANTNQPIDMFDSLTFAKATGPGGNKKTGKYFYDDLEFPKLDVTEKDGTCSMQSENVKTIDLRNEGSGTGNDTGLETEAFEFDCYENTSREVNGAYSAVNDAHFFGNVVYNMYQDWYGVNPLKTDLTLRVHYGKEFENAFWDGKQMTFGDGKDIFYPLVSLDVTAHEVSHGFTEFNSGLAYADQSGGINEAFSDIAGEAAEFYARKKNDFLIGADIAKEREALRFMADPTKDGKSIDNVEDYAWSDTEFFGIPFCSVCGLLGMCGDQCTDVHHSSGIYNKAFYEIATSEKYGMRKAFDIFVKANQDYWSENTDFADGAAGVLDAAKDLDYDLDVVRDAFEKVGIDL